MTSPQTGIFALGTSSHAYLELDLAPHAQPIQAVARKIFRSTHSSCSAGMLVRERLGGQVCPMASM